MNRQGQVYLIGTGPGDVELLTLKAVRRLERADVVLIDDLANPEALLALGPTVGLARHLAARSPDRTIQHKETP